MQFMPSFCTCVGCGNAIGCSGAKFWEEDAPLYAERRATAVASATNPGTSAHFRLLVIGETEGGDPMRAGLPCENVHKAVASSRSMTPPGEARKHRRTSFLRHVETRR